MQLRGRDVALGALRDALAQARTGRGRLAVVSGDAGIGKSTLASALALDAESAGADVRWGRAWEFADAPPYFPVRAALRACGIDPQAEDHRGEGGAFRLWEAVVEALAAASAPVVWVLEDLHAADLQTLDLLTFLAQAARGLRLLVVATTRAKDPRLGERASQRLARMARDGIDVRLAPLDADEVRAVAEEVCGGPLPPTAVARLVDLTGGNPLFVVECARAFKSSGVLGALPPTVRHVVLERFEQLPEATKATLGHAAVLGREFSAARVGRMQGALPARVIDTVLPALRAGLVDELEPGRFAFTHVIVRDVVEGNLGGEERARAHASAEEALASAGDSSEVLVERARHALAAASLGGEEHALRLARRAIALLESEGAADRAYALCEQVAAATNQLGVDDWLEHARIAEGAGRHRDCARLCEKVLTAARDQGDAATFARATLLAGASLQPAVVDRKLVSHLEEALAMLGETAPALSCRLEARLAAALQPHAEPGLPIQMARDAIARARALGDDAVLLEALDTGAAALVDYAPVEERIATFDEARRRADAAFDRRRLVRARTRLALDHAHVGDFAAFDADVDAALAIATDLGHPRFRWRPLLLASMRAMARGEFRESERAIVEVEELAAVIDDPALAMALLAHRLARAIAVRDEPRLRAAAEEVPRRIAHLPYGAEMGVVYRAVIFGCLEETDACAAELRTGEDVILWVFVREPAAAGAVVDAAALAGSEALQRRLREALEPIADLHHVGGHIPVSYDGPVRRSIALLDAALGDPSSATANLERARAAATAAGHRAWIAQLDLDLARHLARLGRAEEAAARARAAETLATELGMDGVAARARLLLADRPGPPPPAAPPARPGFALTLEGDVWRLALGDRTVRVRDSRGMQLLARLVERSDEEIHVLALASDERGSGGVPESSAGDALDDRARRAYRARLQDLSEEIDEAERNADLGRLERLRHEQALVEAELGRAVGLGGRPRKQGSATERARVNVQRRLKDAIARVGEADAPIGRFLERAVRTGTFCCYRP